MTSSRSPVIVFLTIVAYVAAAPSQIRVGNPRFNAEVYSRPEFAEAFARNYEALEWQAKNREDNMRIAERRTLDQLGGGNLLRALYDRNLDHLGGASLLRGVKLSENAIDDKNQKSQVFSSADLWGHSVSTRNAFTDENDLQTNIERNTGDDLLNNMQFDKYDKTRRSRSLSRKPVVVPLIKTKRDGRQFTDESDSQTNINHIAGDLLKDQQFNKFDKTRSERSVRRLDGGQIRMDKGSIEFDANEDGDFSMDVDDQGEYRIIHLY